MINNLSKQARSVMEELKEKIESLPMTDEAREKVNKEKMQLQIKLQLHFFVFSIFFS